MLCERLGRRSTAESNQGNSTIIKTLHIKSIMTRKSQRKVRKSSTTTGWSAIPGKKLTVDIGNRPTNHNDDPQDETGDVSKWISPHYNDGDDENDSEASRDLYDPNSKFDRLEEDGGGEFGMLYSLEVISGDSYRVEKSGDETTGFITKVVYNDPKDKTASATTSANEKQGQPQKEKPPTKQKQVSSSSKAANSTENSMPTTKLNKRQRQQLKRKARLLEAEQQQQQQQDTIPTKKAKHTDETCAKPGSSSIQNSNPSTPSPEQLLTLQSTWSTPLHSTILQSLHNHNYTHPTPIQAATLSAAILGRRDIVGAAPTGSGKTASYAIPILNWLLEEMESGGEGSWQEEVGNEKAGQEDGGEDDDADGEAEGKEKRSRLLSALVLVPTRELALQVTNECTRLSSNRIAVGTIVGGFAEVKQRRILEKKRPRVLVCTPGRLWELMSSKEYSHLNDLSQLRFLVIDEADRMIKQGCFPQLRQIFEVINRANPPPSNDDDDQDGESGDDDDDERLKSLKGVRGEAKVVMLNDAILAAIEREKNGKKAPPKPMEIDDQEYLEQEEQLLLNGNDDDEDDGESDEEEKEERVHRQTFVYSATLTLPPSTHHLIKKSASKGKSRKGKGKKGQPTTVDGAIAEILEIAGARGELKIVDLSNVVPEGKNQQAKKSKTGADPEERNDSSKKDPKTDKASPMTARLPPGLTLGEIRCAQRHKDSHLYAYLVTTQQGSSGPCLVFCNSIAAVRRVGETLKTLGLPVKMLHAQMAQVRNRRSLGAFVPYMVYDADEKQNILMRHPVYEPKPCRFHETKCLYELPKSRLGALESLRTPKSRSIVVASDVAARGLDIPSVSTVVHYDVARTIDTFIHRSGRTARGVGDKAVGVSISLVAPAEEKEHRKICEAVRGAGERSLETINIDARLLSEAQARVSLATKIVICNDVESQASKKNKWLQDTAHQAGLEVDEDMLESGLQDGDQRDRQRFIESKRAKAELQQLLQTPMRTQHFGKFLSGRGLQDAIKTEAAVKPFVVQKAPSKRGAKKIKKKA
eukprot:CCRYP_013914-RB/>CCRYP_013914-RB protein AED:0.12 eAED:0.12 QI:83/0.83/0.85/1/0.83/0.71/7/958/1037